MLNDFRYLSSPLNSSKTLSIPGTVSNPVSEDYTFLMPKYSYSSIFRDVIFSIWALRFEPRLLGIGYIVYAVYLEIYNYCLACKIISSDAFLRFFRLNSMFFVNSASFSSGLSGNG